MQLDACSVAPESWRRIAIKDACRKVTSGGTPSRRSPEFYANGTIGWVKTKELADGFITATEESITADAVARSSAKLLPKDTILLAMYGATVGMLGILSKEMTCNQACCAMLIKPEFDRDFLFYQLLAHRTQLQGLATGAAQQNLSGQQIKELIIPFPPLEEQRAIGSYLRILDDRITILRETNTTLEAIAQALFKSWFVDFDPVHAKMQGRAPEGMDETTATLFPDSFEDSELGPVPKGWSVGTIGDIASVIDCLHSKKPELIESPHPFLQLSNIRDDGLLDTSEVAGISESDYKKWISRIEVGEGDCVITNVGRVGAVAQIPANYKAAMGRNMTAVRLKNEYPYPTYLIELLQSPWMRAEIDAKTDVGTILNALNVRSIPLLRCVLAARNVLAEFESITRSLRATMEANVMKIQTLSKIRDTLLPRLISGQLRIEEAAEALA